MYKYSLSILICLCFTQIGVAQFKEVKQSQPLTVEQVQQSTILSNQLAKRRGFSSSEGFAKPGKWNKAQTLSKSINAAKTNRYGAPKYLQTTLPASATYFDILTQFEEAVDIVDIAEHIIIDSEWTDELNHTHVRFTQVRDGIEVYGSESILHLEPNGKALLQSNLMPEAYQVNDTKSALTQDQVKQVVVADLKSYQDISSKYSSIINGEQWKIKQVYYTTKSGESFLAYFVEVYASIGEHYEYILNAASGEILVKQTTVCKLHGHDHTCLPPDGAASANANDLFGLSRTINTYEVGSTFYLIDASRSGMFNSGASNLPDEPVGVLWTIDAFNTSPQNNNFNYDHVKSNNNNWSGKETAVSAHYNAGLSYEYFKDVHGRNAIDGNGGNIVSIINVADENGNSMDNAFWNGAAMFYGNGSSAFKPLGRGLDVAGHELSHGVIQNTANLEYQGESGALNESFADVFGAMIDDADADWYLIGEDVVQPSAFPSGALRNLKDPHNGASTNDFNGGWQPSHYNERFTGSQDNGGVHINSGIPNRAFYLFANAVGRSMAERVYYRALTTYLTRSSQFADCRNAVVKAATDLGDASVVNAANSAFDTVGIGSSGGTTVEEAETNLGEDFVLVSPTDLSDIKLADGTGAILNDPLENIAIKSKPSISDDGSKIIYVGSDSRIYLTEIDWVGGTYGTSVFDDQTVWRNAVISKDGLRLAAIGNEVENVIYVYDFESNQTQPYELYNPTFSEGVSTGDVLYADAMEFDITGKYLMYDANNALNSTNAGEINYWDIGFIEVWSRATNQFGSGNIQKLFSALPEGVSIGNPTFSKNSPYIIAFDVLEGNIYSVVGYNIETGDLSEIMKNSDLGYPNYSRDDSKMIYDLPWFFGLDIGIVVMGSDKITPQAGTDNIFIENAKWATWFSNGDRDLYVSTEDIPTASELLVGPNPATTTISIAGENLSGILQVFDSKGKLLVADFIQQDKTINVGDFAEGIYHIRVVNQGTITHQGKFVKL